MTSICKARRSALVLLVALAAAPDAFPDALRPYEMSELEAKANDQVNKRFENSSHAWVGPNRVRRARIAGGGVDPAEPILVMAMPGTDKAGHPLEVRCRTSVCTLVRRINDHSQRLYGLHLRPNYVWRTNYEQAVLKQQFGDMAASPGNSPHLVAAVDLSWGDAHGEEVLTLDLGGRVVRLADLKSDEGKRRFSEVVWKINEERLRRQPEAGEELAREWIRTAEHDLKIRRVWGMHDVTMELWQEQGWNIGHCGDVPKEPWHAQPRLGASCLRFSPRYNAALLGYRGASTGITEDDYDRRFDEGRKHFLDDVARTLRKVGQQVKTGAGVAEAHIKRVAGKLGGLFAKKKRR